MVPSSIRLKNFYSHLDSEIDFTKFNSVLLIGNTEGDYGKSNGSGKSAILESILWCLFNRSRTSMMNDIIRWGETTCSVEMEFDHAKKRYKIIRSRNRKNSTSSVEFFYLNQLGEWSDLSGSTSGSTNSIIESTIGLDYKTFVNSIYFRQNDISEFAESDPAKKKDILKSIIDISRWDEYEKSAKKLGRELVSDCKILEASLKDYDLIEATLEESKKSLADESNFLNLAKQEKASATEKLNRYSKEYEDLKKSSDTENYDSTLDEIESLRSAVKSLDEDLLTTDRSIEEENIIIKECNEKIAIKNEEIKNAEDYSEGIDERIKRTQDLITENSSSVASASSMLSSISDIHIIHGECYVCSQEIDDGLYERLKNEHESKIKLYKSQLEKSSFNLKNLKSELKSLKVQKENNIKIKRIESEIESLQLKVDSRRDVLLSFESRRDNLFKARSKSRAKLTAAEDILESLKNPSFKSLQKKIHSIKEEVERYSSSIISKAKDIGVLTERISSLEASIFDMRGKQLELAKKRGQATVFEKLTRMLGKSGIQTILLDGIIDDLESTSNRILSSIANEPILISLETQRVGSDGVSIVETLDLKIRKDGNLQDFKSLSGGEKFRISLALRVALSDLSSRYGGSSLEFLLLDEVNSPLDRYGVETLFVNVIKSLESSYKIMVITHDETLKEKFENVIDVTKVNGDSSIDFINR